MVMEELPVGLSYRVIRAVRAVRAVRAIRVVRVVRVIGPRDSRYRITANRRSNLIIRVIRVMIHQRRTERRREVVIEGH